MLLVQHAQSEVSELEEDLKDLEALRLDLAVYFCEDETTFKLEESLRIFSTFVDKFVKAIEVSLVIFRHQ